MTNSQQALAPEPPHILLVDDEIRICASLKILLEGCGYNVTAVYTGREAIALLRTTAFQVILLDIGLPDISGDEIAAMLHQEHPGTATIIVSGNATIDSAIKALREGVYDFLRKPCDPSEIIHAVNKAMEHKRLEKRLIESENRFRQLASATWEGILIYEDGKLLESNQQLCDMFGYSEEELIGSKIFDLLLQRDSIRTLDMDGERDALGLFEALGTRKDGTRFPAEIRVKRMEHQGRQVQVAAIRDISQRKEMEEKRISLEQKLADARRMESLGLMAGGVAHDLNNILSGVITYPDLLLMDMEEDHQYREEIIMIRDAGRMAAAVVNDLLMMTRGQNCRQEAREINGLVEQYLHSLECRELHHRYPDLRIQSRLDSNAGATLCSAMHVKKAVMNLVINSAEALGGIGSITVQTSRCCLTSPRNNYELIPPGHYATISVSDNGPGIEEKDLRHIFEPFYSTKNMGRSGTGLGLAMVWKTMRDHHGAIDVTSGHGGASFTLFFPQAEEKSIACHREERLPQTLHGHGERILVVDDQPNQREIAKRLLARLGYLPHLAASGEEALDFLREHEVDLVMLDMLMPPGLNGCETYERIRSLKPELKAILISGFSSEEQIERARQMGIVHIVNKPFSLPELSQAIRLELKN